MATMITEPSADSPALVTGDEDAVYLVKRSPSRSGSQQQTVDVWEGPLLAVWEAFHQYFGNSAVDNIGIDPSGQKATLNITWKYALGETDPPPPDDEEDPDVANNGWSVSIIEVPTPLAAHPYFQAAYVAGSGELIEDELARAESLIKRGREYIASGVYQEWTRRYYGLRMAGVEEWTQYGLELSHNYTTTVDVTAQNAFINAGIVVQLANIGMPPKLKLAVDKLQGVVIDQANENSDPTAQIRVPAVFEYLNRPPVVGYSEVAQIPTYEVTESWWGLAQWSTVITITGTWDPEGAVAV